MLASDAPLDSAAWQSEMDELDVGWAVLDGPELDAWVGDVPVLTDDYAPVDQLLTPYAPRTLSGGARCRPGGWSDRVMARVRRCARPASRAVTDLRQLSSQSTTGRAAVSAA